MYCIYEVLDYPNNGVLFCTLFAGYEPRLVLCILDSETPLRTRLPRIKENTYRTGIYCIYILCTHLARAIRRELESVIW